MVWVRNFSTVKIWCHKTVLFNPVNLLVTVHILDPLLCLSLLIYLCWQLWGFSSVIYYSAWLPLFASVGFSFCSLKKCIASISQWSLWLYIFSTFFLVTLAQWLSAYWSRASFLLKFVTLLRHCSVRFLLNAQLQVWKELPFLLSWMMQLLIPWIPCVY